MCFSSVNAARNRCYDMTSSRGLKQLEVKSTNQNSQLQPGFQALTTCRTFSASRMVEMLKSLWRDCIDYHPKLRFQCFVTIVTCVSCRTIYSFSLINSNQMLLM